jgi:hypothetical protein
MWPKNISHLFSDNFFGEGDQEVLVHILLALIICAKDPKLGIDENVDIKNVLPSPSNTSKFIFGVSTGLPDGIFSDQ